MNQLSTNRTLINVIGIPAILYLLWQGGPVFALFIFLVMIIGLDEFYRMNTNGRQTPVKLLATYSPGFWRHIISGFLRSRYYRALHCCLVSS